MFASLFAQTVIQNTQFPGYFVGWGTLSLINAGLAQSKGHSGFFWWILSLILGPVATFLIVVFLDRPVPATGTPVMVAPQKAVAEDDF